MENKTKLDWISIHLPSGRQITRFLMWGSGRIVFSVLFFALSASTVTLKTLLTILDWTKNSLINLVRVYDQLPYAGTYGNQLLEATVITEEEPQEIITDVVAAIEGKQVMVIGEMGTGKSTLAQYLAYAVGGNVKVYECEGTPTDWAGLDVVGKGENYAAIEQGFVLDLDDLSNQLKKRMEFGDNILVGSEKVIICEEFPELVNKVPSANEWLERHARRGRKAKRFTVLLSQYDRVAAWGLEGKSDLAEAFYKIRLGKKAVAHAKSLKDENLINWLKKDRSHCLLDDNPCKLPAYREMKAVTQRLLPPSGNKADFAPKTTTEPEFQAFLPENEVIVNAVKVCINNGVSDSKIIKEVLGYKGAQYQEGKALLDALKRG